MVVVLQYYIVDSVRYICPLCIIICIYSDRDGINIRNV